MWRRKIFLAKNNSEKVLGGKIGYAWQKCQVMILAKSPHPALSVRAFINQVLSNDAYINETPGDAREFAMPRASRNLYKVNQRHRYQAPTGRQVYLQSLLEL